MAALLQCCFVSLMPKSKDDRSVVPLASNTCVPGVGVSSANAGEA